MLARQSFSQVGRATALSCPHKVSLPERKGLNGWCCVGTVALKVKSQSQKCVKAIQRIIHLINVTNLTNTSLKRASLHHQLNSMAVYQVVMLTFSSY